MADTVDEAENHMTAIDDVTAIHDVANSRKGLRAVEAGGHDRAFDMIPHSNIQRRAAQADPGARVAVGPRGSRAFDQLE